jgi:hypothetical protein
MPKMFKAHVLTVATHQKTNHTKEKIVDEFFDQEKGNDYDLHIIIGFPKELEAIVMVISKFFKGLEKFVDANTIKSKGGHIHVIRGKGKIVFSHNGTIKQFKMFYMFLIYTRICCQ